MTTLNNGNSGTKSTCVKKTVDATMIFTSNNFATSCVPAYYSETSSADFEPHTYGVS